MKVKFMVKQEPKLACRWTIEETECFAKILADPDNGFVQNHSESLELKKSYNNEAFGHIQCEFL